MTVRVVLPAHLRNVARVPAGEVTVEVEEPVTVAAVLDALEEKFTSLEGAIREHGTRKRRPFVRFFACEQDWSHEPPDARLPDAVVQGREPLLVVAAIAGG